MSLVLYYDPYDKESYPGEPTTNLFSGSYVFGSQLSRANLYFGGTSSMEMISNPFGIPIDKEVGEITNSTVPISKSEYFNQYPTIPAYGCCPSYFLSSTITIKPKTTYTYSHFYKIQKNDYNNANFLYVYQYSSSGIVQENGVFSSTRRIEYPNGWWRCWGSITTHASASYVIVNCFTYEYNIRNYMWMVAPQFEENSYPTPYVSKVRSGVSALKDISGTFPTIDYDLTLISKSFDTGSNFYFRSINQYLLIDGSTKLSKITNDGNNWSYECWFKPTGNPPGANDGYILGRQGFHNGFAQTKGSTTLYSVLWYSDNTALASSLFTYTTNTSYHLVMTVKGKGAERKMKFYVNGNLFDTQNITKTLKNYGTANYFLGSGSENDYTCNGKIGVVKIHDHELSVMEVSQAYKIGLTKHLKL